MPILEKDQKELDYWAEERKKDLRMYTIGHAACKDDYMLGVQKWRGVRANSDQISRREVWPFILAYMMRRPKERISRKATLSRRS